MRHQIINKKFNRDFKHRKSMLKNLMRSLIIYEKIITTTIKAKYLQKYIEPIITKCKQYSLSNYRYINDIFKNNKIVYKLFNDLGPKFINKNGGYTQILKCGFRKGDNAELSLIRFFIRKF